MKAMEFGDRLSEALEAAGFSKLQFAKRLQALRDTRRARREPPLRKVDRAALYAFLQGRDVPPLDTAAEMARVLGVRLGWLAEGEEPMERGLASGAHPIWMVGAGPRQTGVDRRTRAKATFQELFDDRAEGYQQAEPMVRLLFEEILARRLARRRDEGTHGPFDAAYRANTARGLYLKCFPDVLETLPGGTLYSSPDFTSAFLASVGGWLDDESR